MDLQIERNIPLPPKKSKSGIDELVRQMGVGDSVLTQYTPSGAASVFTLASLRNGQKWTFNARKVEGGVRVWRVA